MPQCSPMHAIRTMTIDLDDMFCMIHLLDTEENMRDVREFLSLLRIAAR